MNSAEETAVLLGFARAAVKAQKIEAILKDLLMAAEVAEDTRNRSFEEIASKIESETLGQLKGRWLDITQKTVGDPRHAKMWKDVNEARIFLMPKFFSVFPILESSDNIKPAARQLAKIDALLDLGSRMLSDVRDLSFRQLNIPPKRLREFLAFVVKWRRRKL